MRLHYASSHRPQASDHNKVCLSTNISNCSRVIEHDILNKLSFEFFERMADQKTDIAPISFEREGHIVECISLLKL